MTLPLITAVDALHAARGRFLEYVGSHRAKNTADGNEKAARNAEMVDLIDDALAGARLGSDFQMRVDPWLLACFGETIARDHVERNHRFLEEALELVQSRGCTATEAHQLVDYVFGRPLGDPGQEVGGVMVTLAALCLAAQVDMHQAGETELARIWTKVDAIRAKQAAKPRHSPLPEEPACCTFMDCPPGLFRWNGLLCFKSEYSTRAGQQDAYCVDSGEYFWGGTCGDLAARRALMVEPITAPNPSPRDTALQQDPVGWTDVINERRRQVEAEGWSHEHDDEHRDDLALARAAACYALAGTGGNGPFWITHLQVPQQVWPYRWEWKPKDRRRNLVRAAALILAEIERLDRASLTGDR